MCEAFGEVVGGEEKWIVDCCAHPALVQKQFLKPPSNRGTRGTPAWPDGPGLAPKLLSNPLHDEKVLRVKLYQAAARTHCISLFLAAGFNGILNCRSSLALHSAAPVGEASDGTAPSTYKSSKVRASVSPPNQHARDRAACPVQDLAIFFRKHVRSSRHSFVLSRLVQRPEDHLWMGGARASSAHSYERKYTIFRICTRLPIAFPSSRRPSTMICSMAFHSSE